jgi:hypothetical protein
VIETAPVGRDAKEPHPKRMASQPDQVRRDVAPIAIGLRYREGLAGEREALASKIRRSSSFAGERDPPWIIHRNLEDTWHMSDAVLMFS